MANYLSLNSRSLGLVERTTGPNGTTFTSGSMVCTYQEPVKPELKVHIRAKDRCPAR